MSRRTQALAALADALAAAGLRPVVDPVAHVVRADCRRCGAGARDDLRLYRPLTVVPRPGGTIYDCSACGLREVRRV